MTPSLYPALSRPLNPPSSWSFTVSSVYSGMTSPTQANMSDGNLTTTSWGSNSDSPSYIRLTLASAAYVTTAVIAPNNASGWGATYINGRLLQYSTDNGASWTTLATIGGVSATAISVTVGMVVTDIRIVSSGAAFTSVGDFYVA